MLSVDNDNDDYQIGISNYILVEGKGGGGGVKEPVSLEFLSFFCIESSSNSEHGLDSGSADFS